MSKRKSLEHVEKKLDAQSLFAERDTADAVPDEVLAFLRDVTARNDTLPIASSKRVTPERASEYLKKHGHNLGPSAIRSIVRTHLNRKGWGHA